MIDAQYQFQPEPGEELNEETLKQVTGGIITKLPYNPGNHKDGEITPFPGYRPGTGGFYGSNDVGVWRNGQWHYLAGPV
jgi:bacteriocin-like protein